MSKIHNNLTIENLTKTDWFKQFTSEQRFQIREGIKENIDINYYAKSGYNDRQLEQIRLGLKANLDVSIYDKKEFDWKQMKQIREELLKESTL